MNTACQLILTAHRGRGVDFLISHSIGESENGSYLDHNLIISHAALTTIIHRVCVGILYCPIITTHLELGEIRDGSDNSEQVACLVGLQKE